VFHIKFIQNILSVSLLFTYVCAFAQYGPINPFVSPNDSTLDYYGSGDINNDDLINFSDVNRLDSIIKGHVSILDNRVYDRSDLNGDQVVSDLDFRLLEEYVTGISDYLPSHWNSLKTKEERISWLEKMLMIDKTNEQANPANYPGDFYSDQLIINFHGFEEQVLGFLDESNIDVDQNGRFNLPVSYGAIDYNRSDLNLTRQVLVVIVGDNVFNWNDWCFIDPQWDQLIFTVGFEDPNSDLTFDSLYNYLDGIRNITRRDTITPIIEIDPSGDVIASRSGSVQLEYSILDDNLKQAWYRLDDSKKNSIYKDSMYLDNLTGELIYAYENSGSINLTLKNGSHNIIVGAEDHFYNRSLRRLNISVDDPPPQIFVYSPVMDSVYVDDYPEFSYQIVDSDLAEAWYSLDTGLTKIQIGEEGVLSLQLDNGLYQIIVYAEDIFQNSRSDTVLFSVNHKVSIVDLNESKDFWWVVFPNPVGEILNVLLNESEDELIEIELRDINGGLIWLYIPEKSHQLPEGLRIDLSQQPPGIYLLKATLSGDRSFVNKIIKHN